MDAIIGKRVDRMDGTLFESGEYGLAADGKFMCCPPGTDLLGALAGHTVIEHDDGTITVSPSILITDWTGMTWHGFLERGIWRTV